MQLRNIRMTLKSHPVRDAWIEILPLKQLVGLSMSHPVRDAWIEI